MDSGTCGSNLTWTFDSEGTLEIEGEGNMVDATTIIHTEEDEYSSIPWKEHHKTIHTVIIGDQVTSIGRGAFYNCTALTNVMLSKSITEIRDSAFQKCSALEELSIPESVVNIAEDAFWGCFALRAFDIDINNPAYFSESDGCIYNKEQSVFVLYPLGRLQNDFVIPNSVTVIADGSFFGCKTLESVTIGDNVEYIGNSSFFDCTSLKTVIIGNKTSIIAKGAFYNCTALESVTIPDSVTVIDYSVFYGCSALKSFHIPSGVTSIGEDAFFGCSSLTGFSVDTNNQNYTSGNDGCLYSKDQTKLIQYPLGNDRKEYVVPNSVVTLYHSTFYGCESLERLTIGSSVKELLYDSFFGCTNLNDITILNTDCIIPNSNNLFNENVVLHGYHGS